MILADLHSPFMKDRILMLKDLPYTKYILHNANNQHLTHKIVESYDGFKVLEHPRISNVKLRYLYSFFYTLYLLLRFRPELIVVHWASRLYQNLLLALWGRRVIVHTMGGDIDKMQDYYGKKAFFTSILLQKCRVITVKSDYMLQMLKSLQIPLEFHKVKRISWGVEKRFFNDDLSQRANLQRQLLGREFDCIFFSVRAFTPFYHTREILQAFNEVFGNSSNVALVVSTMRKDIKYFESCATKLPNIFYCKVNFDDMHQYLFMSDIVVSYSCSDGLPQSFLESVAAKKLIVANNLAQYSELLTDGENSVLFNKDSELPQALLCAQQLCQKPFILNKERQFDIDAFSQKNYYLQIIHEIFGVIIK
ncbi:glycosyltransferase [Helicobacter sp. UBA3407]|uniref:glycosyltransferase n=1 Tax=Helicobacter sp. UBA3407 TaxID=1946588 RepID=UPI00262A4066|nr:glycosyltransferase [Helicobacter sp. UBA3407]